MLSFILYCYCCNCSRLYSCWLINVVVNGSNIDVCVIIIIVVVAACRCKCHNINYAVMPQMCKFCSLRSSICWCTYVCACEKKKNQNTLTHAHTHPSRPVWQNLRTHTHTHKYVCSKYQLHVFSSQASCAHLFVLTTLKTVQQQ